MHVFISHRLHICTSAVSPLDLPDLADASGDRPLLLQGLQGTPAGIGLPIGAIAAIMDDATLLPG